MSSCRLAVPILCLALASACAADSGQASAARQEENTREELLAAGRFPRWLRLSGELRARAEAPTGLGFVPGNDQADLLTRLRLGLMVTARPWLRLFGEWQDARGLGFPPPVPGSIANPLDLRQAWLEVGRAEGAGWGIRAGRQPLRFGKGRLVWDPDWSNCGRVFDGLRLGFQMRALRLDAFAASVVTPSRGLFDRSDTSQMFYGLYLAAQTGRSRFEPYLLLKSVATVRSASGRRGPMDLYTAGMRTEGKLAAGWIWEVETALQRGHAAGEGIRSWAGVWQISGPPPRSSLVPQVAASYSYASGDSHPADAVWQTFDTLYPTTHLRNGATDRLGWANLHDAVLQAEWTPRRCCKLTVAAHDFRLATVNDALYSPGGASLIRQPDPLSRHVGWELSATAVHQTRSGVALGLGCAHLFAGAYLLQAGRADATQPYVFLAYRF